MCQIPNSRWFGVGWGLIRSCYESPLVVDTPCKENFHIGNMFTKRFGIGAFCVRMKGLNCIGEVRA